MAKLHGIFSYNIMLIRMKSYFSNFQYIILVKKYYYKIFD